MLKQKNDDNLIKIVDATRYRLALNEIYTFRELIFSFLLRDIKIRYMNTSLGILWILLNPIILIAINYLVFKVILNIPISLFSMIIGVIIWNFFSSVVSESLTVTTNNQFITKKVYLPLFVFVLSKTILCLLEFLITMALFLILFFILEFNNVHLKIVLIPMFTLFLTLFNTFVGLFVAGMGARFKDFQHIIPIILRVAFYICPIGYTMAMVPENLQPWLYLNPIVWFVEAFRWLFDGSPNFVNYTGFAVISFSLLCILCLKVYEFSQEDLLKRN